VDALGLVADLPALPSADRRPGAADREDGVPGPRGRAPCACSSCSDASDAARDPKPCPCSTRTAVEARPGLPPPEACGCAAAATSARSMRVTAGVVTAPSGAERSVPGGPARPRPRVRVELPMECVERCADFHGETRPRYSYIDVCLLPWSPPEPGTYLRIEEPPQGAPPPWGPVKDGPDRPRAPELCTPRQRELDGDSRESDGDEEPAGLASTPECFVRPVWPPSAPSPVCRALPEPSIHGSPLAVARPDYRGKPSPGKLCDCGCKCHTITGGRVSSPGTEAVKPSAEGGKPKLQGPITQSGVAVQPPQIQLPDRGPFGTRGECTLTRVLYAGAPDPIDLRRDLESASGSCARVVIPPAHPRLADGSVEAVLAPMQAVASAVGPARVAGVHGDVHDKAAAGRPHIAPGPSAQRRGVRPATIPSLPSPAHGADADDEEPLRSEVLRVADGSGHGVTAAIRGAGRTRTPGGRGGPA
jgi:hypothetical protein